MPDKKVAWIARGPTLSASTAKLPLPEISLANTSTRKSITLL
jgi:hypothetical protein